MGGIAIGLHEFGYDLHVVHVDPSSTELASAYLDSGRVDGFILMTSSKKRSHIDRLLEMDAPFIAWGPGLGEYCSVCGDDRRGGRLAADRLLRLSRADHDQPGHLQRRTHPRANLIGYLEKGIVTNTVMPVELVLRESA